MQFHFGKLLGKGMERLCYENLDNPNTCLKVSDKSRSKQTLKETKYFTYLQKKGVGPSFMPKFFGLHETENKYVLEQECFYSHDDIEVIGLREFIKQASDEQIQQMDLKLQEVEKEMLALNVIVTDMRTTNCLAILQNGNVIRLVIFDGYGSPEFFPIANYCPFWGKLKIKRQWVKLWERYNTDKGRFRTKVA